MSYAHLLLLLTGRKLVSYCYECICLRVRFEIFCAQNQQSTIYSLNIDELWTGYHRR